jgi:hypothetical protein
MLFECALFILVVVGMACAVIAALSSLFWPRDLKPHEKSIVSNWKRLKKSETRAIPRPELRHVFFRLQRPC